MDQLSAMRIYLRVAELASFSHAAEQLGLPKASISTAVQRLESQLGTRLLHRTTRRVQMTQDGQSYYERCRDLLADFDELQTQFQPAEAGASGRLRVDMSSGVARHIVLPALPGFLAQHPRLEVELSSTDRRVDVVREGFDCVLRIGTLADSSLVARPLGALPLCNVASPAYLARHGTPRTVADLAQHQLIHYVPVLGARSAGFEYRHSDGTPAFAPMAGAITVNNADAYQAACLAGFGIIQAPLPGLHALLAQGLLCEILPDYRAAPMPVHIVYAHRRQLPRRVRLFMDWLAATMQAHLQPA